MGSYLTKEEQPDDLIAFRRLFDADVNEDLDIPKSADSRVSTDKKYLIVFGVAFAILVPFLVYNFVYADFGRSYGYDKCGNVCGKKNHKYEQWNCTGMDFSDKPFTETTNGKFDRCVSQCGREYSLILGICDKRAISSSTNESTVDILRYLESTSWQLCVSCFLSLGISLFILFLFRSATRFAVWGILSAIAILLTIVMGIFWYVYSKFETGIILSCAVFVTILLLLLTSVMIFLREKIKMVIALLREAMKATFAMPLLLLIPVLTFIGELIVLSLFAITYLYANTSGRLTDMGGYLDYKYDFIMVFTILFIIWMAFWVTQIIRGIQHMVIAGAVSNWYFSKDKNQLDRPILTSTIITFKFHMGTVILGSLVIGIVYIIRKALKIVSKIRIIEELVNTCLSPFKHILNIVKKTAFVVTAMHGEPFYRSGQRASQIIFKNIINVVAHTALIEFVLFLAQLLVVIITLLLTSLVLMGSDTGFEFTIYMIVGIVSYIVAAICFSTLTVVIDTIFLCFCEDELLNNGTTRPYAMSRDLMEFMENSKRIFGENSNQNSTSINY